MSMSNTLTCQTGVCVKPGDMVRRIDAVVTIKAKTARVVNGL